MSARLEELVGKLLIVSVFAYLATGQLIEIIGRLRTPVPTALWALGLAVQLLSLAFVLLVVAMTVRRLPASRSASGFEPRLAAIAGTFLLMLLLWLPAGQPPLGAQLAATLLLLVGTGASIYCLRYLGRSFSILASARELVTRGPYGVVRHPLYLAEGVSALGIMLAHWSWPALLVGAAHLGIQFRRMQHEERVLRDAFPAYAGYAERVPMLLPRAS